MTRTFLSNPALDSILPDFKGNELVNNRFVNEDHSFGAGFSTVLQWMFSRNPQRAEKKNDSYSISIRPDSSIFSAGEDAVVWLGHSAFLFRIAGKRILTDPCLYSLPGVPRRFPSPFPTNEITDVDYILLSHSHRDHFDERSMKEIIRANPNVVVYCPLRMSPLLKKVGAKNIVEAGWYQEFPEDKNGIRFVFLPAKHWNRRYTHDTNRELWGAFWIGTEEQSIYFAGDTAYHTHFKDAAELIPHIKHAFLPIGAYKPDYMMKGSHTSPEEAFNAFCDLEAEQFVPMHYGTYDLSDEPISEPIRIVTSLLPDANNFQKQIVPGVVYPL